jgi:alkanesulfonate monooxygenase SsuD/methylene tetrahydromethanopterin reductase-like flavin-dependent oxidoreductase (luciferase family)
MFTGERFSLKGKHYTVEDAMGLPVPVQKPHPPIMIGGTGEKILLRIVAEHADMWNANAGAERMGELISIIRRHGDEVGRDTDQIEKTVMMPLCYGGGSEREQFVTQLIAGMQQCTPAEARRRIMIGSKDECLETVARYGAAGVTHFIFMLFQPVFPDEVQAFAEDVAPAARG